MATCARVSLTARAGTPRGERDRSAGKTRAARSVGRRGVLGAGSLAFLAPSLESRAADFGSVSLSPGGIGEPLRPLAEYRAALDRAAAELDAIARDLRDAAGIPRDVASDAAKREDDDLLFLDLPAAAPPLAPAARAAFKTRLHADELGAFWVTSRGTDRYVSAARSPFARDREDLWKLLPERSGPLGKILQPDFDNPDDPLCLVYSCVNDPRAHAARRGAATAKEASAAARSARRAIRDPESSARRNASTSASVASRAMTRRFSEMLVVSASRAAAMAWTARVA